MKRWIVLISTVAVLAAARFSGVAPGAPGRTAASTSGHDSAPLVRLPVAFVPNLGQWDRRARYVARIGATTVFLEDKGWTLTRRAPVARVSPQGSATRGVAVAMAFTGTSAPTLVAEGMLPGRHHYFVGNDPTTWRSDVPRYAAVRYREVAAGVDVRAREHAGHFEYDLLLQPLARLDAVEIVVAGGERLRIDEEDGALVLDTGLGPLRMSVPHSWEEGPAGERRGIACRYVLRGPDRFGFEAPGRNLDWALVVDPGLLWSTFVGGAGAEQTNALALDSQGGVTLVGWTGSIDFPTTLGVFDTTHNGGGDVFVTRLSPAGSTLVYSTFLGGVDFDIALAVAVDAQGAATLAGETFSPDFPTTPGAFDATFNGGSDGFVTRLSPSGTALAYSTFLGGGDGDQVRALALDAQGVATVGGETWSFDFPIKSGAFDTTYNGDGDAFRSRLSPTGASLLDSTFLGGTGVDRVHGLVVDAQGQATVAGETWSADFPTTAGAFDTTYGGGVWGGDAFVARFAPTGASLVYSTYLGGSNGETALALAVDRRGEATVAGWTDSGDFPVTPGAFDTRFDGSDAFVTRIDATGASLVYSTFLGGGRDDRANALALDPRGAVTVAGYTDSGDFPTTPGAADATANGRRDAFVARVSPSGSRLEYSTFLGGTSVDGVLAVGLDAQDAATVAGWTGSFDFPTTAGAFDPTPSAFGDSFVARLDLLPIGVAAFGRASPGCAGALAMSVTSMPGIGNPNFALTCGNAPPLAPGFVALTGSRLAAPFVLLGVAVWVDPSLAFAPLPATSDGVGASEVSLPIPNAPRLRGARLFAQFVWPGPALPPPCPPLGFSAAHALEITIQP